jgi:hypothetical protein
MNRDKSLEDEIDFRISPFDRLRDRNRIRMNIDTSLENGMDFRIKMNRAHQNISAIAIFIKSPRIGETEANNFEI